MSPYDKAHELANSLKQAPEFQNFVRVQNLVEQDPQATAMLQEFLKKQWEAHHDALRGMPNQEKQEQLARVYESMNNHVLLKEYFAAEMKFGRLITDLQGILSEAISAGCPLVGKLQNAR